MKKFYTFVLSVIFTCLSAEAAPHVLSTDIVLQKNIESNRPVKIKKSLVTKGMPEKTATLAESDQIIPVSSLMGNYDWQYFSHISNEGQSVGAVEIYPSEIAADSVVLIFDYDFGVVAGYDETSGKISIPGNQFVGSFNTESGSVECFFYHIVINDGGETSSIVNSDLEATFDGVQVTFSPEDCIAFGNSEIGGYFIMASENSLCQAEGDWVDEMPEEGWVFHSNSTFVDPWFMFGIYGVDPAELPYDVVVERNVDFDGLYRIVNPYGESSPLYDINLNSEGTGYIVFSIADPEFVTVYPLVFSGLNDGYDQYLCTNSEGYYSLLFGFSKEEIIEDGNLAGISNYNEEEGIVTFCNESFGTKVEPDGFFYWGDEQPDGSLTLFTDSGVNSVASDYNVTAEYYNLQGMRVDSPVSGQIYVKRQAGKAIKVRVVR